MLSPGHGDSAWIALGNLHNETAAVPVKLEGQQINPFRVAASEVRH
jgi:hypothetical protein